GTSVPDEARRRDCAKSLLGVQIRVLGPDRVRSPWGMRGSATILTICLHVNCVSGCRPEPECYYFPMDLAACPVWIGGEWKRLANLPATPVHNPSTGEGIAEKPLCPAPHVAP